MNNIESVFLNIYCCSLNGEKFIAENFDDNNTLPDVLRIAYKHRVYPMILDAVYCENDERMLSETMQKYIQKAVKYTCRQAQRSAAFLKLYDFLKSYDLAPIVMKGITNRIMYPNPEQRYSADEDLLIPEDQFEKYHTILTEFGMHAEDEGKDIFKEHEVTYRNSILCIELHKKPFSPESKAFNYLNKYFNDVFYRTINIEVYGIQINEMNHTDHLFYQICHAFKHFINCGIGIRLVSDIVMFSIRYNETIDWELISRQCKEIHAYDFVSALYKIGDRYLFKNKLPESLKQIFETEKADEIALLDDILAGGLYGTSSEDRLHSANLTIGAIENAHTGSHSPIMFRTLFPSLENMQNRFSYLRSKPYLLPAAWLHRIYKYGKDSVLKHRGNNNGVEAIRIGKERIELLHKYNMI